MTKMERAEELMFNFTRAEEELFTYLCSLSDMMDGIEKNALSKKNHTLEKNSTSEKNSSEVEKIRQKWMDNVVGLASEFFINEESFNVENLSLLMEHTVNAIVDMLEPETSVDQTFSGGHVHSNHEKKPLTFREKLKQEHPECVDPERLGGCMGCPFTYGYEKEVPELCHELRQFNCDECWDREYKDSDIYSDTDSVDQTEKTLTCREKVKQEHPRSVNENFLGGVFGCPNDYGYSKTQYCGFKPSRRATEHICTACWDQPVQPESV